MLFRNSPAFETRPSRFNFAGRMPSLMTCTSLSSSMILQISCTYVLLLIASPAHQWFKCRIATHFGLWSLSSTLQRTIYVKLWVCLQKQVRSGLARIVDAVVEAPERGEGLWADYSRFMLNTANKKCLTTSRSFSRISWILKLADPIIGMWVERKPFSTPG